MSQETHYPGWTQERDDDVSLYKKESNIVPFGGGKVEESSVCRDLLEKYKDDVLFLHLATDKYDGIESDAALPAAIKAFKEWDYGSGLEESQVERQFVDMVEDGRVGIIVGGEDGAFQTYFSSREEIDVFAEDNPDLPNEILESMRDSQDDLDRAVIPVRTISSAEAVYLIAARHSELANNLAAGQKPNDEFFSKLAEQDAVDFAKLNQEQRNKVQEDIDFAKSISAAYLAAMTNDQSDDTSSPMNDRLTLAELEEIRRKTAAANSTQQEQKKQAEMANSFSVERTGSELPKGLFVIPPSISKDYLENDGAFYSKKDNRLMFHEGKEGNILHTTHKDEKSVSDMLEVAKAKQWSTITLGGSKEFRKAAWFAAESSGIKAKGYSPTKDDLALLNAMIKDRPQNSISNADEVEKTAPRTGREATQAALVTDSKLHLTTHLLALAEQPGFKDRDHAEILKIAEMRALLDEEMKAFGKSDTERGEYLHRFDKTMEEPKTLIQIEKAGEIERDKAIPPPSKTRTMDAEMSR